MIFEKPVLKNRTKLLDLIGYTLAVSIFTGYLTYGICSIYGVIGNKGEVTVLDLINGLAAIATASAFVLGLLQYRKNIIQQRQQIVAAEAKTIIERMINTISNIKTGSETCLENLDKSLTDLSNIAISFFEIYKSLDEDIERAIVRMRWQEMYYSHLAPALKDLDLIELLLKDPKIDKKELSQHINKYIDNATKNKTLPFLKDFYMYEDILNSPQLSNYNLKDKLQSLDSFVIYFMNKLIINDLMYGICNQIDIRVHAPLLAAAKPSDFSYTDLRDKK